MCITPKRLPYSQPSVAPPGRTLVRFAELLRCLAIVPARPRQKSSIFHAVK